MSQTVTFIWMQVTLCQRDSEVWVTDFLTDVWKCLWGHPAWSDSLSWSPVLSRRPARFSLIFLCVCLVSVYTALPNTPENYHPPVPDELQTQLKVVAESHSCLDCWATSSVKPWLFPLWDLASHEFSWITYCVFPCVQLFTRDLSLACGENSWNGERSLLWTGWVDLPYPPFDLLNNHFLHILCLDKLTVKKSEL